MRLSRPAIATILLGFTASASPHDPHNSLPSCPTLAVNNDPSIALSRSDIARLFINPFIPTTPDLLADIESIRATISRYALAIDGRNFAVFDSVFTSDAKANYTQVGYMDGVEAIKKNLEAALRPFPLTQHNMGSSVIQLCNEDAAGTASIAAYSATYVMATHYQPGGDWPNVVPFEKVAMVPVMYQDVWRREEIGERKMWKIRQRNLLYMGALIGSVPSQ